MSTKEDSYLDKKQHVNNLVLELSQGHTSKRFEESITEQEIKLAQLKYRHSTYSKLIDGIFTWLRTLVRSGAWAFVAYCMYKMIVPLVGKETVLRIAVDWLTRFSADQWIFCLVAIFCGIGYYHERGIRRKTVRNMGDHLAATEKLLDPYRTSSQLTETGQPRKEDRDAI